MELHLPCREPLSHLMSQCNYKKVAFDCNAKNLELEISRCILGERRFKPELTRHENITVKCFDPMPPTRYVEFMGKILQRKRIESEYFHRETNRPRDKAKECIWSRDKAFQDSIREILFRKYDYYGFCDTCMGTEQELDLEYENK